LYKQAGLHLNLPDMAHRQAGVGWKLSPVIFVAAPAGNSNYTKIYVAYIKESSRD